MRALIGLGLTLIALFFGFIYLLVAVVMLSTGQIQAQATSVEIDALADDAFPKSEYLAVTGGYVALSVAEFKMRRGSDAVNGLDYVVAPLVDKALLEEWRSAASGGSLPDASRVRVLVKIDAKQFARLWPNFDAALGAQQEFDQGSLQVDLTGETTLVRYMLIAPRYLEEHSEHFNREHARILHFEKHEKSPALLVRNLLMALALFTLAFAALFIGAPQPQLVQGAQRRAASELSLAARLIGAYRKSKVPASGLCSIEFTSKSPGSLEILISNVASYIVGHEAVVLIEAEAFSLHAQPLHERRIIFTKTIQLNELSEVIEVPLWEMGVYSYKGEALDIRLHAAVAIDNCVLIEAPIELASLSIGAVKPACIAEPETPCANSSLVDGLKLFLPGKVSIMLSQFPASAFDCGQVRVGDLFAAVSKVDLDHARLRIIVATVESGGYSYGISYMRHRYFNRAVRRSVVYEKEIEHIEKGQPIESSIDDVLSLQEFFRQHCPTLDISPNCGVRFQLEVELVKADMTNISTGGSPYEWFSSQDMRKHS